MDTSNKRVSKKFGTLFAYGCLVIVIVVSVYVSLFILRIVRTSGITPQFVYQSITQKNTILKNIHSRTSLLFIGTIGGDGDNRNLIESMGVISVDIPKKHISYVPIPLDIWSETVKDTINTTYAIGEEKKKRGGLLLSKVVVEDSIGIPIHYTVQFDFSRVAQLVNVLGGVDVPIPEGVVDNQYPMQGNRHIPCEKQSLVPCSYKTISFARGIEHMDGDRITSYLFSSDTLRVESNGVLDTVKLHTVFFSIYKKIMHPFEWISLERAKRYISLWNQVGNSDMTMGEGISFIRLVGHINPAQIQTISLTGLFENPSPSLFGGKRVLTPITSWDSVAEFVSTSLK